MLLKYPQLYPQNKLVGCWRRHHLNKAGRKPLITLHTFAVSCSCACFHVVQQFGPAFPIFSHFCPFLPGWVTSPLSCLAQGLRIAWGYGRADIIKPTRDNHPGLSDQTPPLWRPEGRASFGLCLRLHCRVLFRLPNPDNHASTAHHAHRAGRAPDKSH